MADHIGNIDASEYHLDTEFKNEGFYIKGAEHADWGIKNRLSNIFRKDSGNTVMLAFDHGYIMGPTSGLERVDLSIAPLANEVDAIMGTRGLIRTSIPADVKAAKCVRVNSDKTILFEDMTDGGAIICDIENILRLNADCMAIQTFIGSAGESNSLRLLGETVNAGTRYGVPTLGVVAVGKDMERSLRYFQLATRVLAETGAHIIKTYYVDGFEKIASACPVPIIIAGGKKLPEFEALEMAYQAISSGARGVDMGRNIFQSDSPLGMVRAIGKIVHEKYTPKQAYEVYEVIKNQK